ncbi:MAG TPA: hypothetical protein VFJ16_24830 [Longimicrobium sp.]|nr:hypothetical protein [Longimicrobium sp.]
MRRWPDLYERAIALLREKPRLAGAAIRKTDEIHGAPDTETLGLRDITNRSRDGTDRLLLQVDQWAADASALLEVNAAVNAALDRRIEVEVAGLRFTTVYDDGRSHPDSTEGAAHRSDDYQMEAVSK